MSILIPDCEYQLSAMRAQGAGGQNVNKVSSAIHLRYDVMASSLSDAHKARLLALRDARLTQDGVLVIKAQQFRSQEMNRQDAISRLHEIVNSVARAPVMRRATRPTYSSQRKRVDSKVKRGLVKATRGKLAHHE